MNNNRILLSFFLGISAYPAAQFNAEPQTQKEVSSIEDTSVEKVVHEITNLTEELVTLSKQMPTSTEEASFFEQLPTIISNFLSSNFLTLKDVLHMRNKLRQEVLDAKNFLQKGEQVLRVY